MVGVDWTQLPPELVETISKGLKVYADYINFAAVCHTWRSSIPKSPNHLPPQLPWLMLPQSQFNQTHRTFFNLSANKFHFLNLPEASHLKRHVGSSHGWLIILDDTPSILLINPITRAKVYLPPLSSFPYVVSFNYSDIGREYVLRSGLGDRSTRSLRQMRDLFLRKVVLSSSPLKESGFIAMAILNPTNDLAYCRNGDESWKIIENGNSYCEDVIFFNGLFYAVNKAGQIAVCDIEGNQNSAKVSFIETPRQFGGDMQYLVSSGDELLLVTRFLDIDFEPDIRPHLIYKTKRFEVFRLDWSALRWERMRSLGDRMVFIGENSSLSLSASDFPGSMGNCIYYTDDYSESNYDCHFGEHDSGIFKLWDGSIESLPCSRRSFLVRLQWPPPLWVSPNPC